MKLSVDMAFHSIYSDQGVNVTGNLMAAVYMQSLENFPNANQCL